MVVEDFPGETSGIEDGKRSLFRLVVKPFPVGVVDPDVVATLLQRGAGHLLRPESSDLSEAF